MNNKIWLYLEYIQDIKNNWEENYATKIWSPKFPELNSCVISLVHKRVQSLSELDGIALVLELGDNPYRLAPGFGSSDSERAALAGFGSQYRANTRTGRSRAHLPKLDSPSDWLRTR